jgi:type IV pilus assembly protein PilC
VSLSLRDKQRFYHNLAQLIRSGIPFPSALEKIAKTSHGALRRLLQKLRAQSAAGKTVGEAFALERPAITVLEASVISAVEKSGRLEHGLQELANYFSALAQARAMVIKRCTYPLFILHFGIFMLAAPKLFLEGLGPYLKETFSVLVWVYAFAGIVALLVPLLSEAAATNVWFDRLLRAVPLVGKIRRCFAISRFCTVYEIQLDAGINVMDSLLAAGRASRSGLVRAAVDAVLPEVRTGAQVGPLLAISGAFPDHVSQSLIVGEETGGLDRELKRLAEELRNEALGTLEMLSEWLPKLIYTTIVLYLGYSIVTSYQHMLQNSLKIIDGE